MSSFNKIKEILVDKGLKITPQRMAVLNALHNLSMHPTADSIIDYVKNYYPNIAIGTVYRTLDTFVEKGIVNKVKTEKDTMRYDAVLKKHHHLYCKKSERIEDYFDENLDDILNDYFKEKEIPGFVINDIRIQIIGNFLNDDNSQKHE